MKYVLLLSAAVLCVGCSDPPPHVVQVVKSAPPDGGSHFTMSEITGSRYQSFDITFSRQLTQNRRISITAESEPWLGNQVEFRDTLIQANGKKVEFDCDAIADKILDAALAKEIVQPCLEGHALADDYWDRHHFIPDAFTDSNGTRWQRAK